MTVRVLFVHQNFPAQFKMLNWKLLAEPGYEVAMIMSTDGFGRLDKRTLGNLRYVTYQSKIVNLDEARSLAETCEPMIHRGEMAAEAAGKLVRDGFVPDLVLCHPGWGEGLFLRQALPDAQHIHYLEYLPDDMPPGWGFDPEFPEPEWKRHARHMRNALQVVGLRDADGFVSPTPWQLSVFPAALRAKARIIFDGIDCDRLEAVKPRPVTLPDGTTVRPGDEILTYIARGFEPVRGFHQVMRALPAILARRPNARVLVFGEDRALYSGEPPEGKSWKDWVLDRLDEPFPADRVHFLGRVRYDQLLTALKLSRAHIYMSYPFVTSWSLVESLGLGLAIVGSRTPPVEEVIADGETGFLVDFFDREALVEQVVELLADPGKGDAVRRNAVALARRRFDFEDVTWPAYQALFGDLLARAR